ncbi:MAG: phytanoyl-CoA dioxygenase family protein [Candidatus Latescibacterota bacterium]|nr:phytanoyl-CoA dioxygenase family protein [Candidatus Latescibacterota bacterium]
MTPEQRYWFDLTGYIHIRGAMTADELAAAQAAAQRYIDTPDSELPPGFGIDGRRYLHGFAFDKALEKLLFHPSIWPIVKELTNRRPRLVSGTLQVNKPGEPNSALHLHCAREDYGLESSRVEAHNGTLFADNIAIFPYLDDVLPGDGGLLALVGSHKASFPRPPQMYNDGDMDLDEPPEGIVNITPCAGDMIIITESLTHGALSWRPPDRMRRILVLRYHLQTHGLGMSIPDEIMSRLSPETVELISPAGPLDVKDIVERETVELS